MINESYRLDVQKWNELRKKFESDPAVFADVWQKISGTHASETVLDVYKAMSGGFRHASPEVVEATLLGEKTGYRYSRDDVAGGLRLLSDYKEGRVTREDASAFLARRQSVVTEFCYLSKPGGTSSAVITSPDDFKGGAISPLTWLYALRAHMRKVPRLHLHGKTLDEQGAYLERAITKAPTFLGALLTKREE